MKKVLFVTYYWPPAGGATTTRVLKFYKYLPEFGWEPIILTVENGDFPYIDDKLLEEVRPDTLIYRAKNLSLHKPFAKLARNSQDVFVPFAFTQKSEKSLSQKISRWVKYNAIPDTRFLWRKFAIREGLRILRRHPIDLIFSSSPPQTNHCVAVELSRRTGIPCVGDMRDPWTDVYWLQTDSQRWRWIHRLDQKIESKTMNSMAAITTVSPGLVKVFSQKFRVPVYLIYNGFEPVANDINPPRNKQWTITYAGSISIEQDITPFCQAIEILSQQIDLRKNVRIRFIGNFPEFVRERLTQYSFFDLIEFIPYMPAAQVRQNLLSSDVLLLFVHVTPEGGVCNYKMYEYLSVRRPILAYGPTWGDAAAILQRANAGKMFEYHDPAGSARYLLQLFEDWLAERTIPAIDEDYVMSFTRRNQTKKLAEIFDQYSS
jgi:glycosyltransferase involved in cell wall biosynthesis